jgi:adhesin/invasin
MSESVHHFDFDSIANQRAGTPFEITITAKDRYNNTVLSYFDNGSLTFSNGTITPTVTSDFANGVWRGDVTVTKTTIGGTITYNDGAISNTSNSFDVNPGVLSRVAIAPESGNVSIGNSQGFVAQAFDAYDNAITSGIAGSWNLSDSAFGTLSQNTGMSTTFNAGTVSGSLYLNIAVTENEITKNNSALINVLPGQLTILRLIRYLRPNGSVIDINQSDCKGFLHNYRYDIYKSRRYL